MWTPFEIHPRQCLIGEEINKVGGRSSRVGVRDVILILVYIETQCRIDFRSKRCADLPVKGTESFELPRPKYPRMSGKGGASKCLLPCPSVDWKCQVKTRCSRNRGIV